MERFVAGPFVSVWPVVAVDHRQLKWTCCLEEYPPEWFQPWWEADAQDRAAAPLTAEARAAWAAAWAATAEAQP